MEGKKTIRNILRGISRILTRCSSLKGTFPYLRLYNLRLVDHLLLCYSRQPYEGVVPFRGGPGQSRGARTG